jgi:imidazole glycerol-phosphate synthase subunit HisF
VLRPRVIPCLLVKDGGLVKTVQFAKPKYVGDPINAVRIFNEKEVDELIVLDIDVSSKGRTPDYQMIRNLAAECRMPLCYGGGVTTVEQAEKIIGMGVEKVAISAAAIAKPTLVAQLAAAVGSQSVVVVIDAKRNRSGAYEAWTHNAGKASGRSPQDLAMQAAELGAGEIVVNSVDRDGTMQGYDLELVAAIRAAVHVPITALGGAGSLQHVRELIERFRIVGAAAGSLFVFKGVYRAVLINYPQRAEKDALLAV